MYIVEVGEIDKVVVENSRIISINISIVITIGIVINTYIIINDR
jgi:hypothetical protein